MIEPSARPAPRLTTQRSAYSELETRIVRLIVAREALLAGVVSRVEAADASATAVLALCDVLRSVAQLRAVTLELLLELRRWGADRVRHEPFTWEGCHYAVKLMMDGFLLHRAAPMLARALDAPLVGNPLLLPVSAAALDAAQARERGLPPSLVPRIPRVCPRPSALRPEPSPSPSAAAGEGAGPHPAVWAWQVEVHSAAAPSDLVRGLELHQPQDWVCDQAVLDDCVEFLDAELAAYHAKHVVTKELERRRRLTGALPRPVAPELPRGYVGRAAAGADRKALSVDERAAQARVRQAQLALIRARLLRAQEQTQAGSGPSAAWFGCTKVEVQLREEELRALVDSV